MNFSHFCKKNNITPPELKYTKALSLYDPTAWSETARILGEGGLVGFYNLHVAGILLDASSEKALLKLNSFKGSIRRSMPLGCMIPWDCLISKNPSQNWIDISYIPYDLIDVASDAKKMRKKFNGMFVRFPVNPKKVAHIPCSMLSVFDENIYYLQVWDPYINPPLFELLKVVAIDGCDIAKTAVTSFNKHGEKESIDQLQAIKEADRNKILLFLYDQERYIIWPKDDKREHPGSYPIVQLMKNAVLKIR